MLNNLSRKPIFFIAFLFLAGCASQPGSIIVVKTVDDIPNISEEYKKPLAQLKKGMSLGQVNALFPNVERECYESGTCHFTVFDEKQIRLDKRLVDLDLLSGTLFSLLALTCALSEDSCGKALAAAINVGIATSIEHERITTSHNASSLLALVQMINMGTLGTQGQLGASRSHSRSNLAVNEITLIQWINIEFEQGRVTQWAVNEPLEQFKPKSFDNELPSLDEALGLESGQPQP